MGDLYAINLNQSLVNPFYSKTTSWNDRPLNQIMIAGSHDGGMFTITSKSGLGFFYLIIYYMILKIKIRTSSTSE